MYNSKKLQNKKHPTGGFIGYSDWVVAGVPVAVKCDGSFNNSADVFLKESMLSDRLPTPLETVLINDESGLGSALDTRA
jgi:hypothetical protein